jgi:hypothetical protein
MLEAFNMWGPVSDAVKSQTQLEDSPAPGDTGPQDDESFNDPHASLQR